MRMSSIGSLAVWVDASQYERIAEFSFVIDSISSNGITGASNGLPVDALGSSPTLAFRLKRPKKHEKMPGTKY